MARIGVLLLLLTQWSNLYAWSCSYDNGSDGWYLEGSMVCIDISVEEAIQSHYCDWHRPDDPYCTQYQETTCVDTLEYKTEACTQNYMGSISYVRYFTCQTDSFSEWTVSSDNCVAMPFTCVAEIEQRFVECPPGYEGQANEQRLKQCPDPYGTPQYTEWLANDNTCTQSVSDPISPISQTNPVTNPVSPIQTEPVTVPEINAPVTTNPVATTPQQKEIQKEISEEPEKESDKSIDNSDNKEENKQDRKNKKTVENKDQLENGTHEILPGFGITLSLDILQQPLTFYEPPLQDLFDFRQEFAQSEDTREFQFDLFRSDYIENYYDSVSNHTWERLRSGSIY